LLTEPPGCDIFEAVRKMPRRGGNPMNYHTQNKQAWEEAYDKRKAGWGEDIVDRIREGQSLFLGAPLLDELLRQDPRGKSVGQFCCNNGRELLSVLALGAARGTGFDIAENMVAAGNACARELGMDCRFISTDILEIDGSYAEAFDILIVTIGALTWFEDLNGIFRQAARCLKPGGVLIIHEMHPITGMLPMEGDDGYDPALPNLLAHSYFKKDPWVEGGGMGYMSDGAKEFTETFYSYSHPMSDIVNAVLGQGLRLEKLDEHEEDISEMFPVLEGKGIPLSFLLVARK
jgi:SAM-dependent methyltransferase